MGTQVHFTPGWRGRWDVDRTMRLVSDLGIGWVRDAIYWGQVEKSKGVYQVPDYALHWIAIANREGIKVSITFNGANPLYEDKFDPDAYAKAAAFVAGSLAGKIDAMEILNEPYQKAYRGYYGGQWNGVGMDGTVNPWVSKYVVLLNKAAKAIREANPDIKVTGLGSVAPVNFRQIAMGIAPEVDGITDHPYSYRLVPELVPWAAQPSILKRDGIATADERGTFASQIAMYRELLRKHKGPREIWLTEWGWSTFQEAKRGGIYAGFTESAQAKYFLRRFVECIGIGVDRTFQYDFRDDGQDPYYCEDHFGMVRHDYSPKPSYHAAKRLVAALANARVADTWRLHFLPAVPRNDIHPMKWDGSQLAASGEIRCYQFVSTSGEPKAFFWSSERADGDFSPQLADIEMSPVPPAGIRAHLYNVYTESAQTLSVEIQGDRAVIRRVTIPDAPVCLTLK